MRTCCVCLGHDPFWTELAVARHGLIGSCIVGPRPCAFGTIAFLAWSCPIGTLLTSPGLCVLGIFASSERMWSLGTGSARFGLFALRVFALVEESHTS